ncbi:MAG: hypothetical protein MHM6MM_009665 [Cercozoa sp. M6MM]
MAVEIGNTLFWIGGVFAFLATILTLHHVRTHAIFNQNPVMRKHVLRILLMVPVYALQAWLGLRFPSSAIVFDTLRDLYEAFVMYSFFLMLVEFVGGEPLLARALQEFPIVRHIFPLRCVTPWRMGDEFLAKNKLGILQYVPVKLLCAALTLILSLAGAYTDGALKFNDGYLYVALLTNCSQMWALYCLAYFYLGTKDLLAPLNPVAKFMCIKAVIMFTWWQSVALAILVSAGVLGDEHEEGDKIAKQLQDFIICIEMFLAALAHRYAFPVKDFYDPGHANTFAEPFFRSIFRAANMRDVLQDVGETMPKPTLSRKTRQRRALQNGRNDVRLLDDDGNQVHHTPEYDIHELDTHERAAGEEDADELSMAYGHRPRAFSDADAEHMDNLASAAATDHRIDDRDHRVIYFTEDD